MQKGQDRMLTTMVTVKNKATGQFVDIPAYKMLDTEQMAIVTGLSNRWFQDRRKAEDGPTYYRCTDQVIRYLWPDWVDWLQQQEVSRYARVFDD